MLESSKNSSKTYENAIEDIGVHFTTFGTGVLAADRTMELSDNQNIAYQHVNRFMWS